MTRSKLKSIYVITTLLFITTINMHSQTQKKALNYSKHPYWIEMMNDPKANYFETIKAYDEFWAKRQQPTEEDEIIGESQTKEGKRNLFERFLKYKEKREEEEIRKYAFAVKKFRWWKMKVEPFVQEDGSILDADARLKLWEDQKQKN